MKTHEGDRRNLIIKCSDEMKGNAEYFNKLKTKINSKNLQRTFYEFLMKRKDAEFFRDKPLPKTTYQEDLKESLEDPLIGFLREYVVLNYDDIVQNPKVKSIELYKLYQKHITEQGLKYEISHKLFAMKIRNLDLKGLNKSRSNSGNLYIFDSNKILTDLKIDKNNIHED